MSGGVVVTGGQGRLGRLIVHDLRATGVRTRSFGRSAGAHEDDVTVDLRDAEAVVHEMSRAAPDVILHLAAVRTGGNVESDNALLDAAVVSAARHVRPTQVVQISSAAVYGTSTVTGFTEGAPLRPAAGYAASKAAGEQRFRQLADDVSGVAVTVLRVFNVAGPSFPDSLVTKLLRASPARPVPIFAPDTFIRDYIHQWDVIAAVRAAMATAAGFRIINVGSGVPVSTNLLLELLGVHASHVVHVPGDGSASWADVSRIRSELRLEPQAPPSRDWALATLPGRDATK